MATKLRITIVEARPALGQKCVVFDGEGQTYNCGILTTNDHVKLRFSKSTRGTEALVSEKDFDFEVAFGASDDAMLNAFKKLVDQMQSPSPSSESSTLAPQPEQEEKKEEEPKKDKEDVSISFDSEEEESK